MSLLYCEKCTRVYDKVDICPYCSGEGIALKHNSPVNVIGTKLKGRIFKVKKDKVLLLITRDDKSKVIKEYTPTDLRKIL